MVAEFENDPENSCFGCGPNNPVGLRLKFFKTEDDKIFAEKIFDTGYSAWSGQVHGGVIFAALECTCQWTFYTRKGIVGPTERFTINFPSRAFVGEPSKLVGRVTREDSQVVSVRADLIQAREVRATMDQDIRVVHSREEFMKLRPAVRIDSVMERNLQI